MTSSATSTQTASTSTDPSFRTCPSDPAHTCVWACTSLAWKPESRSMPYSNGYDTSALTPTRLALASLAPSSDHRTRCQSASAALSSRVELRGCDCPSSKRQQDVALLTSSFRYDLLDVND